MTGSANLGQFVVGELRHGAIGGRHIDAQMRGVHVGLPQRARLPALHEHEMRRVLVVLLQLMAAATGLRVGERKQLQQLGLDQRDQARVAAVVVTIVSLLPG